LSTATAASVTVRTQQALYASLCNVLLSVFFASNNAAVLTSTACTQSVQVYQYYAMTAGALT
jgi:hypothetical protein